MEKSAKRAVMILSAVVAVLVLAVIYAFAVRPALNGYATKAYNQGVYDTVNSVVSSVAQNGYVRVPVSNNQSVTLVPYQQPSQTQTAAQNTSAGNSS